MSFPNSSITDIIATSLEARNREIADNVTDNNAVLKWLSEKGNIKKCDGGRVIWEEFSFAENSNGTWFEGYEELPVGPSDVISGAEFNWKQYAVPVVVSGRELIQNSGRAKMIDLLDSRMAVAESTMRNALSAGLYSDGTGSGGKILTGLDAAVPASPTTGTYGGINRATAGNEFWRSQVLTATTTAANVQSQLTTVFGRCTRGSDSPDLIVMGSTFWGFWMASLQTLQRFTGTETAKLGFNTTKFMSADCVLDGGVGGNATTTNAYLLNTNYLYFRPHTDTNMVPGKRRMSFNQDAYAEVLLFAGNLTSSGPQFCGRITGA